MKAKVYKCFKCKEEFPEIELTEYNSKRYCHRCLQEKLDTELFYTWACETFHLKTPGAVLLSQRKRLKETYGYSDALITGCLNYLFKHKGYKINYKTPSLGLVAPWSIEEFKRFQAKNETQSNLLIAASAAQHVVEHKIAAAPKKTEVKQDEWEGLLDDDTIE